MQARSCCLTDRPPATRRPIHTESQISGNIACGNQGLRSKLTALGYYQAYTIWLLQSLYIRKHLRTKMDKEQ